ncbi:hypothetical protein G6F35_008719 [Rhizopus arrhizus]|nr:hypothetical protein G6F35_008719 [Rhizopus arrhizus]
MKPDSAPGPHHVRHCQPRLRPVRTCTAAGGDPGQSLRGHSRCLLGRVLHRRLLSGALDALGVPAADGVRGAGRLDRDPQQRPGFLAALLRVAGLLAAAARVFLAVGRRHAAWPQLPGRALAGAGQGRAAAGRLGGGLPSAGAGRLLLDQPQRGRTDPDRLGAELRAVVRAVPAHHRDLRGAGRRPAAGRGAVPQAPAGPPRHPPLSRAMGHRLSRIYTRTGDDGSTGLGDGQRVAKDDARVASFGTVDEANAALGLLLAASLPEDVRALVVHLQHQLFDLGAELCIPGHAAIHAADVSALEQQLDHYNAGLPMLKEFILPAGGEAAARCHLARTIVRRAERETVALARREAVRSEALQYLNRLSDLLFVLARVLARADGHGEALWQPQQRQR